MLKNFIKKLFIPAVKLLSRLWYWQKFLLLIIVLSVPVFFALFFFTDQIYQRIEFSKKEITGTKYISAVQPLLRDIQQHRGIAALYLKKDKSLLPLLLKKEEEIKRNFVLLKSIDSEFGKELETTEKLKVIQNEWLALEKNYLQLTSKESTIQHTKFISGVLDLVYHAGDTSNLILDPDLDTYYLMNSSVNTLPYFTEELGRARAFIISIDDPENISDLERRDIINHSDYIKKTDEKIERDLAVAIKYNSSLAQVLVPSLEDLSVSISDHTKLLDTFINKSKIEMPSYEYYQYSTKRIDKAYSFHNLVSVNLENLLKQRVDRFMNQAWFIIGITVFSYLIIIYFMIGLYLLFKNTLKEFRESAQKLSVGELREFPVWSRDELGEAGKSFNEMAIQIRNLQSGLETRVAEQTSQLSKQIAEAEEKNALLGDTKRAILNLLEDAREFENQLKNEKESVEKKVIERTREYKEEQARLVASIKGLSVGFILIDINSTLLLSNPAIRSIFGEEAATIEQIASRLGSAFDLLRHCQTSRLEKKPLDFKDVDFAGRFLHIFIAPVIMVRDHEEVIGNVILVEDETEARVLERSKDEFFSIASHELRTPLTAIRGNSSLIKQYYQDKIQDKDLNEMINDIHESSVRLIGIVNDFLDISRLEQRKMEFKLENFDIEELISKKVKEVKSLFKEKNLTIQVKKEESKILRVYADAAKLGEVILNLLGNAAKYTDKGGVVVNISEANGFIKVSFADTGKGISAEEQTLLFRKFQQAGESILTRDTTEGTGLGLYISKLMIDRMGGKIKLESSSADNGSVFYFTVPVAKQI